MVFRLIRLGKNGSGRQRSRGLPNEPPFSEFDCFLPRIDKNNLRGLLVFFYWHRNLKTADSKATGHSQEDLMFRISS